MAGEETANFIDGHTCMMLVESFRASEVVCAVRVLANKAPAIYSKRCGVHVAFLGVY